MLGESFDVKSKFNIIGVGEVRKKSSIWINKVLWSFVGFKNKLNDQKIKKKFEFFLVGVEIERMDSYSNRLSIKKLRKVEDKVW